MREMEKLAFREMAEQAMRRYGQSVHSKGYARAVCAAICADMEDDEVGEFWPFKECAEHPDVDDCTDKCIDYAWCRDDANDYLYRILLKRIPDGYAIDEESRFVYLFEIEDTSKLTYAKVLDYSDVFWELDRYSWQLFVITADRYGRIGGVLPFVHFAAPHIATLTGKSE